MDITLRDPAASDAPAIAEHANDYEIAKMLATMPYPYTINDAHAFLAKIKDQQSAGKGHSLIILAAGDFAGTVGWFYNEDNVLEIGYWVARKFWGRSIAGKAVVLILDVIRKDLPEETEVLAQYMDENPASARVLEKCGFVHDGANGDGCISLARGEATPASRMILKF